MSFFVRLYDAVDGWVLWAAAVALLLLIWMIFEWHCRREEARWCSDEPDPAPAAAIPPPDVEPVAPKPKRANKRKAVKRRHK